MPRPLEDLTGRTYGSWTVLQRGPEQPGVKETIWTCLCDCGEMADIPKSNLTRGRSTRCVDCRARVMTKPKRARLVRPRPVGTDHHRWRGDEITYATAHSRVRSARGKASEHMCVNECGNQADSWAYRGNSAKERTEAAKPGHRFKAEGDVLRYSPDPVDYDPMCWRCHARKDVAEARARGL